MILQDTVGYRCNSISAIDGFLPVRDVLKLEMFGDSDDRGFRNMDSIISEFIRLFPELDEGFHDELFLGVDLGQLEYDDNYRYEFTDRLIKLLQDECNIPREYFNYGIWLCDSPQDVADSYSGVNADDISRYRIKGVLLQDLGIEGKLYGVAEYPEETIAETSAGVEAEGFERIYEMSRRAH